MNRLAAISICLLLVLPCRAGASCKDAQEGVPTAPQPALQDFIDDRTLITSEGVWHSSPALADLDGDGRREIIVGSLAGYVYAWHCEGRLVEGWLPKAQQGITSSPAVGDLDGDGRPEVICVGNVWHHDGTPVKGWPQPANPFCTPALADIDLDGDLEVIFGNDNGIDIRHHDGRFAAGWPQKANAEMRVTPAWETSTGTVSRKSSPTRRNCVCTPGTMMGRRFPAGRWPRTAGWKARPASPTRTATASWTASYAIGECTGPMAN